MDGDPECPVVVGSCGLYKLIYGACAVLFLIIFLQEGFVVFVALVLLNLADFRYNQLKDEFFCGIIS